MHLRRQSFTNDEAAPSIDPVTNSGYGTAHRQEHNELQSDRRNVIAVMKGRRIDGAPISEEKTDLVQMGKVQVMARSGNDAGQHEEEWEGDGEGFDEIAGVPEAAPAAKTRDVLLLAGVLALLVYAWRKPL
jgi:hypothetical protein